MSSVGKDGLATAKEDGEQGLDELSPPAFAKEGLGWGGCCCTDRSGKKH